jgi:hypothetical protein
MLICCLTCDEHALVRCKSVLAVHYLLFGTSDTLCCLEYDFPHIDPNLPSALQLSQALLTAHPIVNRYGPDSPGSNVQEP